VPDTSDTLFSFSSYLFSWYNLSFSCCVTHALAQNLVMYPGELLLLFCNCDGTSGNFVAPDLQTYFCLSHFFACYSRTAIVWTTNPRCNLWHEHAKNVKQIKNILFIQYISFTFTFMMVTHRYVTPKQGDLSSIWANVIPVPLTWPQHAKQRQLSESSQSVRMKN
jgi:hypothetical protein